MWGSNYILDLVADHARTLLQSETTGLKALLGKFDLQLSGQLFETLCHSMFRQRVQFTVKRLGRVISHTIFKGAGKLKLDVSDLEQGRFEGLGDAHVALSADLGHHNIYRRPNITNFPIVDSFIILARLPDDVLIGLQMTVELKHPAEEKSHDFRDLLKALKIKEFHQIYVLPPGLFSEFGVQTENVSGDGVKVFQYKLDISRSVQSILLCVLLVLRYSSCPVFHTVV